MRWLYVLLLSLAAICYADDDLALAPEPISLVNETAVPSAIVNGCVNAITGNYVASTTDSVLSGQDPYVLARSYISSSFESGNLGYGWNFCHSGTLQVFQPQGINFTKGLPGEEASASFSTCPECELCDDCPQEELCEACEICQAEALIPKSHYSSEHQKRQLFLHGRKQRSWHKKREHRTHKKQPKRALHRPSLPPPLPQPPLVPQPSPPPTQLSPPPEPPPPPLPLPPHVHHKHSRYKHACHHQRRPYGKENTLTYLYLNEPFAGQILFKGNGWAEKFRPVLKKTGWTNTSGGPISGRTNINNISITFDEKHDIWHVTSGDGTERIYTRLTSQRSNLNPNQYNFHYRDYHITEERLPNGNRRLYEYGNHHYNRISSITTLSSNDEVINFVRFTQLGRDKWRKHPSLPVTTSEGKSFLYSYKRLHNKRLVLTSITHPDLPEETLAYNDSHQLTKSTQDDSFLGTHYDRDDKVACQYAPIGPSGDSHYTHKYFYHSDHTTVSDAHDNYTSYFYDKEKRLTRLERRLPGGDLAIAEEFTWDDGYLDTHTLYDEDNHKVLSKHYSYDSKGNITRTKLHGHFTSHSDETLTTTATYSDDDFNLLLSSTDPLGNTTYYTYKPHTNLLASRITKGKREFFSYDEAACLIKTITDDGTSRDKHNLKHVTERHITRIKPRHHYPHFGDPEEIAEYVNDTLLKRAVNTFTKQGLIASTTIYDANNSPQGTTTFTYDGAGRLISTSDPLGRTITNVYDAFGRIITKKGPRPDYELRYVYDAMGRIIAQTEYLATIKLTTRFTYDLLGNKTSTIDPQGNATTYRYDSLKRLTKITLADGATRTSAYRHLGRTVEATDERGYTTTTRYNALGKPLSCTLPDGTTTRYSYDLAGNRTDEYAANGLHTTFIYDRFHRCTSSSNAFGTTRRIYSTFHLLEEESPTHERMRYSYDSTGRKIAQTAVPSDATAPRTTTYTYDSLSRLATTTTAGIVTSCSYDILNRPTLEKLSDTDGRLFSSKATSYDLDGNVFQETISIDGRAATTTNNYFPNKLLSQQIDALGNTTSYIYDFFSRDERGNYVVQKTVLDARGISTETRLNTRHQPVSITRLDPYGHTLTQQSLTYDASGNLTATTEQEITTTLTYGPCNRLESIVEPEGKTTRFAYNRHGQKSSTYHPNGIRIKHAYDAKGRLATSANMAFTYDASDRVLTASTPNGTTIRTYNGFGELASETLETGLTTGYA